MDNAAKHEQLGVPAELLDEHGAVSAPVVEAMAAGAAERAGARLAVAVSGIAGPDGGSPEKPVGLVWFGVSFDGRVTSEELRFPRMGRVRIRERAKNHALVLMLRTIRAV